MTIGLMLKAYDHMSAVVATASGKSIVSLSKVQEDEGTVRPGQCLGQCAAWQYG